MQKLSVNNEWSRLDKVIIHRPDDGIERVTPKKSEQFLYDDIVFLPRMRKEHDVLTGIFKMFLGKKNVLETEQLFYEALQQPDSRKEELLKYVAEEENLNTEKLNILKNLDNEALTYTLFTGILKESNKIILDPLPNYVFTRDIGVMIKDHILICQASKKARTRESLITYFIVYFNPLFAEQVKDKKIIDFTEEADEVTLEGGDVMMYDNDYLLVGCSERSTPEAFDALKKKVFEKKLLKSIVKIEIPRERSCMHIDTVFTQISKDHFVIFKAFLTGEKTVITEYTSEDAELKHNSLEAFLRSKNPNVEFIYCGNGEYPYDEREQWTDGCNLVALNDGVAIAYKRNYKTAQALTDKGYKVVDAQILLKAFEQGIVKPSEIEKTIISIPSTELSRARGGPHCMSFPLSRV
ncbi:MAG: arginine deiminase family protein [Chitinophagales bacterium]